MPRLYPNGVEKLESGVLCLPFRLKPPELVACRKFSTLVDEVVACEVDNGNYLVILFGHLFIDGIMALLGRGADIIYTSFYSLKLCVIIWDLCRFVSRVADDEPERLNTKVEGREGVAEGCAVALCRRFPRGDQVPRKHLRISHAISVSQTKIRPKPHNMTPAIVHRTQKTGNRLASSSFQPFAN